MQGARDKGIKEISEIVMTENFPKINIRQWATDPGSSEIPCMVNAEEIKFGITF